MKLPNATTSMDRPVNLFRATAACNTFYVFLSAAKAALLPFLTLFFRLIGLSALETGIVMAAKTLTGFFWAPLWARCAIAYNKRRVVLIFSLYMMGLMYMSFIAVYYKVGDLKQCQPPSPLDGQSDGNVTVALPAVHESGIPDSSMAITKPTTAPTKQPVSPTKEPVSPTKEPVSPTKQPVSPTKQPVSPTKQPVSPTKQPVSPTKAANLTTPAPFASPDSYNVSQEETVKPIPTGELGTIEKGKSPTVSSGNDIRNGAKNNENQPVPNPPPAPPLPSNEDKIEQAKSVKQEEKMTAADLAALNYILKNKTGHTFRDILHYGLSAKMLHQNALETIPNFEFSEKQIQELLDLERMKEHEEEAGKANRRFVRTLNVTFVNSLKEHVEQLTAMLEERKLLMFIVVLLVIIFGEFFSSPVEKIADDAWFDFLERIDDMERYGRQRYWGSLTFALIPILVTCLVDYTPCHMMLALHHFLLHFYVFGVFIIFTIFIAFYFPMPPPAKQKYSSKLRKGLHAICCDARGFLFVVTLLVAGIAYSTFNNFLFWHLQDMGSSELIMGLCVAVGAFAETPMLVFSNKLVRKLGHGGLVTLSLLILALRQLYYGFLWTPWAVVPVELTNAFTHTALWYAVLSYEEFNVGSAIDRSIRSILSSVYFGLGFSAGALLSGLVYDYYGASILFWGSSVLCGVWCLLFSIIHVCLPKKERVKYIKLLRKEEDESSDAEDDWLEMTLKEQ
jgi:MFS family permease